ncbi:hypothetical protein HXX76_014091 [Chlamydomonas incerta]|uniref:DNA mismatch repair proteins mutS family domain-containing protein n=1 Tax=Chlamydomonas incerta TaxID=51695 RepID=A0A835VT62_CHLIN|nr:hypothetical protein HXX76_014091 [Chlamydomonas incerta]|eukprot:KAG2424933.1 hypothetical protein HXX76_014091 [Chlamydomonas incerta]
MSFLRELLRAGAPSLPSPDVLDGADDSFHSTIEEWLAPSLFETSVSESCLTGCAATLGDLEVVDGAQGPASTTVLDELDFTSTHGGVCVLRSLLSNPVADLSLLKLRQRYIRKVEGRLTKQLAKVKPLLARLTENERHVAWFLRERTSEEKELLEMVYFSKRLTRGMNNSRAALTSYNMYKLFVSPTIGILSPIVYFIIPYMVLKMRYGLDIDLFTYLRILYRSSSLLSGGASHAVAASYLFSMAFYFQSVFSSIEVSATVKRIIGLISMRYSGMLSFVTAAHSLAGVFGGCYESAFFVKDAPDTELFDTVLEEIDFPSTLDYRRVGELLIKFRTLRPEAVRGLCLEAYVIDSLVSLAMARVHHGLSYVSYRTRSKSPELVLQDCWHICLPGAVRNSITLGGGAEPRNVIVTGPNAGGKSTFVKAIMVNAVMAHTIGLVAAASMSTSLFTCLWTQMNVPDYKGKESLFEAEMHRSKEKIDALKALDPSEFAMIAVDEMFSSTEPIEGLAAAYAIAKTMAQHPNTMLLLTTHYKYLCKLEAEEEFANYKMTALVGPDGDIRFPYKLHRGISDQRLALELLRQKGFESHVIERAIQHCMFGKLNPLIVVAVVLVFVVVMMYQRMKMLAYRLDDLEQEVTDLHNEHAFCGPPLCAKPAATGNVSGNVRTSCLGASKPPIQEDDDDDIIELHPNKPMPVVTIIDLLSGTATLQLPEEAEQELPQEVTSPPEISFVDDEATPESVVVVPAPEPVATPASTVAVVPDAEDTPSLLTRAVKPRREASATAKNVGTGTVPTDIMQTVQKIKATKRLSKRAAASKATGESATVTLCSPVMMDGRAFTDYRSKCAWVTGESSFEMRQRLTRDADSLIAEDRARAIQNAYCPPCFDYSENGTMLPAQNTQVCNARTCTITTTDPTGLGLGGARGGTERAPLNTAVAADPMMGPIRPLDHPVRYLLSTSLFYLPEYKKTYARLGTIDETHAKQQQFLAAARHYMRLLEEAPWLRKNVALRVYYDDSLFLYQAPDGSRPWEQVLRELGAHPSVQTVRFHCAAPQYREPAAPHLHRGLLGALMRLHAACDGPGGAFAAGAKCVCLVDMDNLYSEEWWQEHARFLRCPSKRVMSFTGLTEMVLHGYVAPGQEVRPLSKFGLTSFKEPLPASAWTGVPALLEELRPHMRYLDAVRLQLYGPESANERFFEDFAYGFDEVLLNHVLARCIPDTDSIRVVEMVRKPESMIAAFFEKMVGFLSWNGQRSCAMRQLAQDMGHTSPAQLLQWLEAAKSSTRDVRSLEALIARFSPHAATLGQLQIDARTLHLITHLSAARLAAMRPSRDFMLPITAADSQLQMLTSLRLVSRPCVAASVPPAKN